MDLHVTYADTDTIEVVWSPFAGDYANYLLYYTPPGATFQYKLVSKAEERKWRIEGLVPGEFYTIRLQVQSIDNTELHATSLYQFTSKFL